MTRRAFLELAATVVAEISIGPAEETMSHQQLPRVGKIDVQIAVPVQIHQFQDQLERKRSSTCAVHVVLLLPAFRSDDVSVAVGFALGTMLWTRHDIPRMARRNLGER